MRIVIAPDKFKGSLEAAEVCAHVAAGLRTALPEADLIAAPMADGGEGTVDAAMAAGFARHTRTVVGPLGAPVQASFALQGDQAVIELAAASGLLLIPPAHRDALAAHTFGTGELIAAALDAGARRIVLAVGGSAATDGGTGMLTALGARFLDATGECLPLGGGSLPNLCRIDLTGLDPRLTAATRDAPDGTDGVDGVDGIDIVLASDVDHLLTGERGAARVFAPQKGATPEQVEILEAGLVRLAEVQLAQQIQQAEQIQQAQQIRQAQHAQTTQTTQPACSTVTDHAQSPGAGAAGGVGFGTLAMLGAKRQAGAEIVAEVTGLAKLIHKADLVITGEGSFDAQSLGGKTPMGVLAIAHQFGVPTVLVCGRLIDTAPNAEDAVVLGNAPGAVTTAGSGSVWQQAGFSACYSVAKLAPDAATSMRDAARYLEQIGTEIGTEISKHLAS